MQDGARDNPSALTAAQLGIWLGQQLDQGSPLYNAAEFLEFPLEVDVAALEAAIARCMTEAEALAVRFEPSEDGPRQRWVGVKEVPVARLDFSLAADPRAEAERYMRADAQTVIDLRTGPLFRNALIKLGPSHSLWYFAAHHAALDGFGFALIQKRVAELYTAQVSCKAAPSANFGSLRGVVAEDEAYQGSVQRSSDLAYFERLLSGFGQPVSFSEEQALASSTSIRCSTELSAEVKQALDTFARTERVSWVDAVVAGFAAFLGRVTSTRDLVLGFPVMCRQAGGSLRVPSMLMNIVPLCLVANPEESFASLVAQVRANVRELMPHARYRYEHLRRDLNRIGGKKRLFGPVVNVIPFDHGFRFAGQYVKSHNITAGPVEDFALNVYAHADGRGPKVAFDANPACYDAADVQAKLEEFIAFISEATRAPHSCVASLWAPEAASAPAPVLRGPELAEPSLDVVASIRAQAAAQPERIAVECGESRLSYAKLVSEAERVAQHLLACGVAKDSLVAIAMPRCPQSMLCILGVLLAGAAYLPLDVAGPRQRMLSILDDAKPQLLLSLEPLAELPVPRTLSWHELQAPVVSPVALPPAQAEALAYVIYTSGSTGKPNGVMIERAALSHFVSAARQRYGFVSHDRVLQFAPLHFDASVEELFVTWSSGGTLVLRSDEMIESVPRFLSACEALEISVLDLPTAFWHEVAYHLEASRAVFPARVRIVIIGGEAALPEHARRFLLHAGPKVALFNTYGPTEATVVATSAQLAPELLAESAPIGVPLPGVAAQLFMHGLPVSQGAVGELYLLGPGLARGYLGRPALTTRRFVRLAVLEGAPRAYRSGDLVRVAADGQLVFVGRVDDELKLSGHRIDPLEIENVLSSHASILECAVVAQSGAGGSKTLVAHVVASEEPAPELDALRAHARRYLSGPSVPSLFVFQARLPRSRSGKIDRAALRTTELELTRSTATRAFTPLEQTLTEIWQEVLGVPEIALDDDFFELGGQSLQTIRVVNRLSAHLGREVPAALLFRHPSIADLARALSGEAKGQASDDGLLERDATLPDDIRPQEGASARTTLRKVLLTGATGFVGAHLLSELLARSEAHIVCLVRAKDAAAARLRVQKALGAQGLSSEALQQRVEVLPADLAQSQLGLSAADYARLSRDCDAVLHCGASVSLVRGYASLRAANVLGTAELLRFAVTGALKSFHHVSTVAAASGAERDVPEAFVAAQPALSDGYAQSKWAAERLVAQAQERGVPVSVYRLGRVVGPRDSGYVNPQDIVWRLLRVGIRSGVVPNLRVSEPWTEVDRVARAVVGLAHTESAGQVYNLTPATQLALPALFAWVTEYGYALRTCPLAEFRAVARRGQDAGDAATLSFFDAHAQDDAPREPRVQGVSIARTRARLEALELSFPSVDQALVHRYLDYCVSSGFLPPPQATTPAGG